ncbi:E3 ubiquitin-protein ligase HUWE1 [Rhodotorula toruloides NP11]|uniref:HECT-type E3 ubiquitin transferase n=1 Tax=Rhodotorula toruloides (strain NP11) TaxID=1130832 RepID=M7WQH5_RHOT1|nr:E3 ubiquitin-protein ligase HUWE1 [Rhodotorula toruloides NP11]EMS22762.1 E3 ubiquitin-protein ligase HUWE1 [Rhodotorula toruloides NP11]
MARLKRQPKKGGSAHPGIASFITQLQQVPQHELPSLVQPLLEHGWEWPKTDLQHWVYPLNRFDEILENVIRDYDLGSMEHCQTNEFTPRTKELLLSVLGFQKLLLENSTNRKIFNGFDRINDLLHTTDISVLLATLRLALRPAQQFSSINSSLNAAPFSEKRLLALAQSWGTREHGIELYQLAEDRQLEVPLESQEPEWQFYRKAEPSKGASENKSQEQGMEVDSAEPPASAPQASTSVSTPAPVRRTASFAPHLHTPAREAPSTPAAPTTPATGTSAQGPKSTEGLTTIHLPNLRTTQKSAIDILLDLAETHHVPDSDRLDLLQRIRIGQALSSPSTATRQQLLVVRLFALAVFAHSQSEQAAQLKIFLYEPDLIAQVAELVHPERDVPVEVRSAALYALEAFGRRKSRTAEVASALNASVSHGVLMETVRKMAADLDTDEPETNVEYIDALFHVLTYMNIHTAIGSMVIGAGIVSVLLDFLRNERRGYLQLLGANKANVLLDGFVSGYSNAFTAFMSAGGLNVWVARIKTEVDEAVSAHADEAKKLEASVKENALGFLPFQQGILLKSFLRALQRLLAGSGTTEGLRNVIDTSLLDSIKTVMQYRRVFGPQIFSLAANIAATFVHNEPTSLAALQEAKVPEIFYDSLEGVIPAANEVLQSIPHAIGAFCLNQAGLDQLLARPLVDKYFEIFTTREHVELLRDRDSAVILGSSIEELIRHHPALKEKLMKGVHGVLEALKANGERFVVPDGEEGYNLVAASPVRDVPMQELGTDSAGQATRAGQEQDSDQARREQDVKDKDKKKDEETMKNNEATDAIDVFGRFLEGLFQNTGQVIDDFFGATDKVFETLLDLLALPCSPAIMEKNNGYSSIAAMFRIATETKASEVLSCILRRTDKWMKKTEWFWNTTATDGLARESPLAAMVSPPVDSLPDQQKRFRDITVLLSHISLLSDVFTNLTYAYGKPATVILSVFTKPAEQGEVLERIGRVYRACQWENVAIRPTSFWTGEASQAATEEIAQNAPQGEAPTPAVAASREHQQERAAEKAAVEAISTPATPDSPNIKLIQDVLQAFTRSTLPFMQAILKLVLQRRTAEAAHRAVGQAVAEKLARFLRDSLEWPEAKELSANLAYAAQSLILVTKLLFDERPNGLQVQLLRSFVACGGFEAYLRLFERLQAVATDYFASTSDASTASPLIIPVFGGLKTVLELLVRLTAGQTILEAPQTAILLTREKDPASRNYFNAPALLVRLRAAALPAICAMWEQPWLRKCPQNVVRSLVATLINVLKAEGEDQTDQPPRPEVGRPLGQVIADGNLAVGGTANALNAMFGGGPLGALAGVPATPPAPDETRIAQLMDMGFPRGACETALRRTRNNVALATEYLLQHPDVVGAARDEEARQLLAPAPLAPPADAQPAQADNVEAAPAPLAPQDQPAEPAAPAPEPQADVEMGDANADGTVAEAAASTTAAEEPPATLETPIDDVKKELKVAREKIETGFIHRTLELAEDFADLVFDVKNVFNSLAPPSSAESGKPPFKPLLDELDSFTAENGADAREAAITTRLRLIALITTDVSYRETVESLRENVMSTVMRFERHYSEKSPAKDARPKWLAPLMLVADSMLAIQDVPRPTEILAEGSEVPSVELVAQGPAWANERKALFELALDVLDKGVSTRDVFISTLRLLLCLTRDHDVAAAFAQRDGVRTLLSSFAIDSPETKGCRSYAVMILRHVVEDQALLKSVMEREIEGWFGSNRSKVADATGFVRATHSVALRNIATFLEAAKTTIKLVRADAPHHYHVTLQRDDGANAGKQVDSEPLKSPLNQDGADSTDAAMGDAPTKAAGRATLSPAPQAVDVVVHLLMQQALDTSKGALAPVPRPAEGAESAGNAPPDASKKDAVDAHIPADTPLDDFYQSAFSLACLAELVASYNPCKASFLAFSTRKGGSKETVTPKSRSSFLYFLLNDLALSSSLAPLGDFDTKRASSMWGWASLVVVGLCYDSAAASTLGNAADRESANEITVVRKAVLEVIARAFRDAMASSEPTETRYARLACLSDLCHRLLTARPFPNVNRPHSETSMQLAKLMLEKNFAVILTNALADVDLNYPHVNVLINAILRPLDHLTKIVTKLGRAKGALSGAAGASKDGAMSSDFSSEDSSMMSDGETVSDESDVELSPEDQAAADLYRNSALGMYEGELEQGQPEEFMSEDEEAYDEDDDEMMEEEFDGSEFSDASDLDDDEEHGGRRFSDADMEEMAAEDEDDLDGDSDGEGSIIDADDVEEEILFEEGGDGEDQLEAFEAQFDGEENDWVDEDDEEGGGPADGGDELVFGGEAGMGEMDDEEGVDEAGDSEGGFTDEEELLTGELEFDPEMTEQLRAQSTAQAYGWDPVTGGDGASARRNRSLAEDMMMLGDAGADRPRNQNTAAPHPLLAESSSAEAAAEPAARRPRGHQGASRDSPAYREWVRSVEAMLGPGGVNTLEEILGTQGLSHLHGPEQVSVQLQPTAEGGMAVVIQPNPGARGAQHAHGHDAHRHAGTSASQPSSRSVARQLSDRINAASAFLPLQTNQRWYEESRILQGCVLVNERIVRLANHLINVLHGPARETAKEERRKEEERRREAEQEAREVAERLEQEKRVQAEEEERRRKQAEEEKAKEEADTRGGAEASAAQTSMEVDNEPTEEVPDDVAEVMNLARSLAAGLAVPSTSGSTPAATSRQGTPANAPPASDTTPSGGASAPAGEAAAPVASGSEDAPRPERVAVLVHGEEVDITDTGIDREFLEALPDDMRDEVIRQHLRETRTRSTGPPPALPEHINSEFLDALPPALRDEVLRQEAAAQRRAQAAPAAADQAVGRADEPADFAEVDPADFLGTLDPALRSAVLSAEQGNAPNPLDALLGGLLAAGSRARRGPAANAAFQAVGGQAGGPDRGGVPLGQPGHAAAKKSATHREVIQLLDKSGLATLVRLLFFPQPLKRHSLQRVLVNLCENGRTRVELVHLLLTILHDGTRDVSAVDKSFSQMSLRASRALVTKETPKRRAPETPGGSLPHFPGESVPNLIAQRCLEALGFLVQANEQTSLYFLTEQEVPVSKRAAKKGKGKEKAAPTTTYPIIVLLGLLERPATLKTPAMMEAITTLLAQITRSLASIEKPATAEPAAVSQVPPAPNAATGKASSAAAGSTAPPAEPASKNDDQKAKDVKDAPLTVDALSKNPPQIPATSLGHVVNVLDAGECSSRTFSQTLGLIQNLSHLDGAREIILGELKARAEKISQEIVPSLVELLDTIGRDQPVGGVTLGKFTPASSNQAKLLRILKTIDFFGAAPKRLPSTNSGEPASKSLSAEEEQVKQIYSSLSKSDLWKRLGDALGGIEAKPDLLYLSTVLLPLIESLLVVNKFTDASSTEFIDFTTAHSKILNTMVRNNPSLMSGSFAVLVRNSSMLDFENKRSFFFSRLHDRSQRKRPHYPTINLNVRRAHVFEDSFHVFNRRSGEEIKYGKLNVKFYDEEGVDAGGVTREWFGVLARQMFNPGYALFQPQAADSLTYQPNKSSAINENHLEYFRFVGRLIGKAIFDQRILEAHFSRSVYKHMLGKPVDHRDLESIDPEYYKSLVWMLENDIEGIIDLTFSVERDEFGVMEVVDLIPNGRNIPVTNENKHDYVRRIADQRLSIEIKDQMDALLKGLYDVVSKDLLQIFSERELELLISGLPTLDVDDMRAHTDLVGFSPSDPVVAWFWRAVRSFSQEERAKLLQFVSGSSRVPLEGFAALQGMNGVTRFNIHKAGNNASLPTAHTCFNQLDLPTGYESYEHFRRHLSLAIHEGATGFAFA